MKYLMFLLLSVSTFLSGCIIQSSQLKSIVENFTKSDNYFIKNRWSLNFGEYQALVYPVNLDNKIIFLNNNGDYVVFDGWLLSEIRGLGRNIQYSIRDHTKYREFKERDYFRARHICIDWDKKTSSNFTRYNQKCQKTSQYINTIIVDQDGMITLISQTINNRNEKLTLTKLAD